MAGADAKRAATQRNNPATPNLLENEAGGGPAG